jgi:aspartate aminotransferase-like enzyme
MKGISATLKKTYNADAAVVIPGSGTFGMEAVARQFAVNKKCVVIRNGWFSFRWTQIIEQCGIADDHVVLKAKRVAEGDQGAFAPVPIEEAVAAIKAANAGVVFAPHVETSSGVMLPDSYIKALAEAAHSVGGLFVLDGIAAGTLWIDMKALGVDVYITAPQKGWSGPACCGLVMLSDTALAVMKDTTSNSFAVDLKKWHAIMEAYEKGGHAYHTTMPTDALTTFYKVMQETEAYGFEKVKAEQIELGQKVYATLAAKGVKVVAAPGFEAPGVVVCYTTDATTPKKFAGLGMQIAGGVPLQCDEGAGYSAFRLGLFGLDKLHNVDRTVQTLVDALDKVLA